MRLYEWKFIVGDIIQVDVIPYIKVQLDTPQIEVGYSKWGWVAMVTNNVYGAVY